MPRKEAAVVSDHSHIFEQLMRSQVEDGPDYLTSSDRETHEEAEVEHPVGESLEDSTR